MTNKKNETDSCRLCDKTGCAGCNLSSELTNNCHPSDVTTSLIKDGYLLEDAVEMIHIATLTERAKKQR